MADSILDVLGMQQTAMQQSAWTDNTYGTGLSNIGFYQYPPVTYPTITVTGGATQAVTVQAQAIGAVAPPESPEIAWLKRRVREIEWRP